MEGEKTAGESAFISYYSIDIQPERLVLVGTLELRKGTINVS